MSKSYTELEPWQRQVWENIAELKDKIDELGAFTVSSGTFAALDETQQSLLRIQLKIMMSYEEILTLRTHYF